MLGPLAAATGASPAQAGWFSTAYGVALAVLVLPAGVLAGRIGPRAGTRSGLTLTAAAGLIVLGWSVVPAGYLLLVAAEVVAGVGGALVLSGTFALITAAVPDPPGRARALGLWSAALVAGLGGGPFLAAGCSPSSRPRGS